jgi:hypothetical protein
VQLGMQALGDCHHLTRRQSKPSSTPTYRVRICRGCSGETCIELGSYTDQESAILINDAHEILAERYHRLLVLTPADAPYLSTLFARRHSKRGRVEEKPILEILKEKIGGRDAKVCLPQARSSSPCKRQRCDSSSGTMLSMQRLRDIICHCCSEQRCLNSTSHRFTVSIK